MAKYAEYDQVWLVKSAGLVLGPFSFVELTQALKDKSVSLLDEVRTPSTRWGFVRETPQLTELVKIIREAEAKRDGHTARMNLESGEPEDTESVSATLKMIETTPAPFPNAFLSSDDFTKPVRLPAEIKERRKPTQGMLNTVPQPHGPIDFAVGNENKTLPTFFKKKKNLLLGGAALAFILLITFVSLFSGNKAVVPQATSSADLFKLAQRMKNIGFYDKSLMMYERALGPKPPEPMIKFEMLPLYLQSEDGVDKAQQWAKELSKEHSLSPDMSAKIANWLGISFLRQRQYAAAEVQFKTAAVEYPMFVPISINRAINQYLSGQLAESVAALEALKDHGVTHPMISLTQGLATLYLPSERLSSNDLVSIINELKRWTQIRKDFGTVLFLFIASLQDRGGFNEQVHETIGKILEQTAGIDRSYSHELDVDTSVVAWSRIKGICENLATRHAKDSSGLALGVFCKLENEDYNAATGALNSALQRFPGDPHLLALQAQILKNQGSGHEAKELLVGNQTRPGLLIRTQACLDEKDLPCAESALQVLLRQDPNDPETMTGLVQLELLRNKRDLAQQTAEKGLSQTSNFKPLVEIREEMGDL